LANALDALLARIADKDLRQAIAHEVGRLKDSKDFGLVFERHLPESVRLAGHPITRGSQVQLRADTKGTTLIVKSLDGDTAVVLEEETRKERTLPLSDLVSLKGFGEVIYPGFKSVGRVRRGEAKPSNVLINGENYYVLESLLFAFQEKVDVIYIDPPYNTGARDWKYNNNYVDDVDAYRHSKWLAFMERRLRLAKRLLKPEDSTLIVTIDEKEYLRLGLLLEQIFPEAQIQMVSSVINPRAGVARAKAFTRVDEYIFFVLLGDASISSAKLSDEQTGEANTSPIWFSLMRTGTDSSRRDTPNLFYPVWVNASGKLHSVGNGLPVDYPRGEVAAPAEGLTAIWPLRPDGSENRWQLSASTLRRAFEDGTARLRTTGKRATVSYLRAAEKRRIEAGEIEVLGKDEDGALILRHAAGANRVTRPKTVWNSSAHDAGLYGSQLLRALIPNRKFPFPKSLYAVEDTLRFALQGKPNALVLDFFAGSGTTGHAVMRLNKEDQGNRRFILVTNNEVSEKEASSMRKAGLSPGDQEWENQGIFSMVTRPRLEAAVTGRTPDGKTLEGDYKFTNEFPMAEGFQENIEFLELEYLDANNVSRGKAFESLAPLLWMRAGFGPVVIESEEADFAITRGANYAILFNLEKWQEFIQALRSEESVRFVFIVSDSRAAYQQVIQELSGELSTSILYEDYLRNFEISIGEHL